MSALERLLQQIRELFGSRAIKDVSEWDGSASQWPDTDAYCGDCLIDVNAAAGRDTKAQSHCMLPIRGPDDADGTVVAQALYAAAGGRGLGRVSRPDDVPEADWDAAVKKAANAIIAGYDQIEDAQAPDAIYEMAGKTPPEREQQRGRPTSDVIKAVYDAIAVNPNGEMTTWIEDLYIEDDGSMAAIVSSQGKLWKIPVTINGDMIELGEWQEVRVEFLPVQNRSSFTIIRQADGKARWFALTETSALLRGKPEIDSRELFDDFLANIPERGYPQLRFYHDDRLVMGSADWAAREGYCLLASGTFDNGELARAMIESAERGDVEWGVSNGYDPTEEPEKWRVAEGIEIPVYKRGIWREISVLPESRAASWFTSIGVRREATTMREEVKKQLEVLFGDPARAAAYIESIEATNREIEDKHMITREGDQQQAEPQPEAEPVSAEPETTEYELKEEDVTAIAERVRESLALPDLAALAGQVTELRAQAEQLNQQLSAANIRLQELEKDEEQKQREWLADLPANATRRLRVGYRPRQEHAEEARPQSMASIADATLAEIG